MGKTTNNSRFCNEAKETKLEHVQWSASDVSVTV